MELNKLILLSLVVILTIPILASENLEVFILAARDGNLDLVKTLLAEKKVAVNDQSKKLDNQTALMAAIFRKPATLYTTDKVKEKKAVVEFLLKHGASKNIKSKQGKTASELANIAKAHIELSRLLLENDESEVNKQDKIHLDEQDKIYDEIIQLLESKSVLTATDLIELSLSLDTIDTIAQA